MKRRAVHAALLLAIAAALPARAKAFTHIVQQGDTLASLAEEYYGRIQHEKLLVAANALDAQGGSPIVPGMPLEVPALEHRRIKLGDSWPALATDLLGAAQRADVLSAANGSSPWLTPAEGTEIAVPYNLPVIAGLTDTTITIAYRYLGDMNKAWVLDHYNGLGGRRLQRGDVLLVPLTDIALTDAGKLQARLAAGATCSEAGGDARSSQRKISVELPSLIAEVRGGRYVDAVARGSRFLASANLSKPQLSVVHRQLLEAYVALDAAGAATAACAEWRKNDPGVRLDPERVSPKIIAVCERAAFGGG